MRIGLLARADNRGLGTQTWEAYRHLQPARTLVVDMGDLTPYEQRFDRYPDCPVAHYDGTNLESGAMEWLFAGSDVVFTCETPYDYKLYDRARERGVKTVCQVNPEFYRYQVEPRLPRPDLLVAPTTWMLNRMPGVVHLPHGVDRERLPYRQRTEAKTFLHVVGHHAMADRAGTELVYQAMCFVRAPIKLIVRTQGPLHVSPFRPHPRGADIEVIKGDIENYWDLYDGADVLIAPRRYGGQSLPMNEALSCGMPVITLDREPERSWGGVLPVAAQVNRRLRTQAGPIDCYTAHYDPLVEAIERLAAEPDQVAALSARADEHARSISWEAVKPRYLELFAGLLNG